MKTLQCQGLRPSQVAQTASGLTKSQFKEILVKVTRNLFRIFESIYLEPSVFISPVLIGIIHESYDLRDTYKKRQTAVK